MSQGLTITIDGMDGRIAPDSVGNVLRVIFALLRSLDERSWPVGTARVRWQVSGVQLVNPLTLAAAGEELFTEVATPPTPPLDLIESFQEIGKDSAPADLPIKT